MQLSLSWVSSIPGTVGAGCSMALSLGDKGGCRVGTRHPLHELQLLAWEHPAGACSAIRCGAARRWSGAGDEPRDFPGAAVPGGGEPGTESL